ncbi:HAD family hydrolase [Halothiobacillus neapolitanus]|jgi:phosphoglycolate phosphatase|uniref:Phosphoglycolate phosphatase n=1 Tax=Halothiobacillus neapolitanus (strain ATCC 23641 / DSM 15147 / CIP 104769 / NCIMB 8539 / c2) TaxID=555778 RepID=D0L0F9_HALNC|nr:HAD-IA family hydrolase [Halothiobacillus neapolitanus]ACX96182.1 phosphoglycolate phosphatase [Halothiobacillus neapolitanus c2]OZB76081.1 MAG: phosphoglycolate phosphatase, bacterial [Halothiobacillus sp. 14-55-98]TDN66491.1 phosphoglycolate phosphatase [Halothiobacillus neapolitanus]
MRFDTKLPSNQTHPVQGVLFDLDGTLIDTAPDMALALNRLRLECNLPPMPFEQIRPQVSNGARGLLEIGFQLGPNDQGFAILRDRFLQLYRQDIAGETRLFAGFDKVIDWLNKQEMHWGIVTNKPGFLTRELVKELDLKPAVVIAGDDLLRRKPYPDQLIYAAGQLRLPPQHILYVGDHERDIQASRAAHMPSAAVRWGYLDGERPIEDWLADVILTNPTDLLDLLSPTPNPN